ncbi:MAG: translation elongation factor 4 [Alphaproteobacteria bacterium]
MQQKRIRNFAIIAHIDHGKSTLADRFLEICGALAARDQRAQHLDSMELERERGITIKAQTARLTWRDKNAKEPWILNLLDTPGHVDFAYEVSRSLAACEGALVVVDAAQGIEAQTLANIYAALEQNLEMIAALNKIDLPAAEPERVRNELVETIGFERNAIFEISAKTGQGVPELLDAIAEKLPPPNGQPQEKLSALLIDSWYDPFLGVVLLVRVINGKLQRGERLKLLATNTSFETNEIGHFTPHPQPTPTLSSGEIGYVVTGLRQIEDARVGDTLTHLNSPCQIPLAGFEQPKSVVFCGLFPANADDYEKLRSALQKLALNDASLDFEPESSPALGFGFRAGFLGLLHLEVIIARLEREFDLELVTTAPSVIHRLRHQNGRIELLHTAAEMPSQFHAIEEPWVRMTIFTPKDTLGSIITLCQDRRGQQLDLAFASKDRAILTYLLPLHETVFDFHDRLKSISGGFASYDYRFEEWKQGNLVKVSILVNAESVEALAFICEKSTAEERGRQVCLKLKQEIPRQLYKVAIQAAIGGKIIARETVSALRKDVTAKCYGGDVSRKRKLLDKQKEGKKRMRRIGSVEIPHSAFLAVLKRED